MVNVQAIRNVINESRFFVSSTDQPAWQVVWHALDQTEDVVLRAVEQMELQLTKRELTTPVEILHIFGLRLWLADIGVLSKTPTDVVREGKEYLDELYAQGRMSRMRPKDGISFEFNRYVGRLEVYQYDSPEYKELYAYFTALAERARIDDYPAQGRALLVEMERDPDLYFRRICFTNSDDNIYARVPLLPTIDPDVFVERVLQQPPVHQKTVFSAFRARYHHGEIQRELISEQKWLKSIQEKFLATAESCPPLTRHRIRKHLEWYVDPYVL